MDSIAAAGNLPIPWSYADILESLQIKPDQVSYLINNLNSHIVLNNQIVFKSEIQNKSSDIFTSISTDSRTIKKDQLFVAIKGERFDGHNFVRDLLEQGIRGFVVERGFCEHLQSDLQKKLNANTPENNILFFQVDDTLKSLGLLARFQRIRSGVKIVAITGSNGKTTTRKMTTSIFEQKFKTLSTQGNLNNEIGLPLTLLNLSKEHEWAVVEMGMNHHGEIARLSNIACPDIAIITNTTNAHLEGLGSVEAVARAKAEITEGMNPKSTLIINGDDPRWKIIVDKSREFPNIKKIIFFGSDSEKNHFAGINCSFSQNNICFDLYKNLDGESKIYNKMQIKTPAPFMIHNALASTAAAFTAEIEENAIRKGLLLFEPVSGRMKIIDFGKYGKPKYKDNKLSVNSQIDGVRNHKYLEQPDEISYSSGQQPDKPWLHIIDDTYNANPGSVKAAIETLKILSRGKESVAVLGDMLELGDESVNLHFMIGKEIAKAGISKLYAYGDMASEIVKGALVGGLLQTNILHGTKEDIVASLLQYLQNKVKTSNEHELENSLVKIDTSKRNRKEQKDETDIWILIKGSRGMKMEVVVKEILKYIESVL